MTPAVLVFSGRAGDVYRVGRTLRSLARRQVPAEDVTCLSWSEIGRRLLSLDGPVCLLRAGAWYAGRGLNAAPPASATGMPLVGLGMVRGQDAGPEAHAWQRLQVQTGGDYSLACELPEPVSVYLERPALVGARLLSGEPFGLLLAKSTSARQARLTHLPDLDVYDDVSLRVVQVVTSFQRGGAERVTLDLLAQLPRRGGRSPGTGPLRVLGVGLGNPGRETFPLPPGVVDLSRQAVPYNQRLAALADLVRSFAADLIHVHLLHADQIRFLAKLGVPLVVTVHNLHPGWPPGLEGLQPGEAHLLVGCAAAVEKELKVKGVPLPTRTVWNGIDFGRVEPTPARAQAGRELRGRLGFREDDVVLLALANPRPQKRLHLLPGVLAATRAELLQRGVPRQVRLLLVGEQARGSESARSCVEHVQQEVDRLALADHVRWLGATDAVAAVLAASDILVSTSAHEGLSLAQLEALAAGRAVVATAVGGAPEIAAGNPAVSLVPADAPVQQMAAAVTARILNPGPAGREEAVYHFSRFRMADRHAWLYPHVIASARKRDRRGLWLVANNFSTGGAQSSARRLLQGLAGQGVRVRAAVLQEHPERPTFGRRRLVESGIRVVALPPPGEADAAASVAQLLEEVTRDPPQAVLLWNVITSYKVLLAEGLLDVPLFDVSPGEMYFSSLEQYFARPRPGLPYRSPPDYGARLAGVIVKYHAEREQAAALGAPVHVIPNGVPVPATPWSPHPDRSHLVMGTLVRISPQKKLGDLLEALRRCRSALPPHVLRIAGSVEQGAEGHAEELKGLARGLNVEWVGGINEPEAFLRELDFFVLVAEPAGCPNASLEALALGVPVIVTDVGGTAEQLVDGQTGRLVARGNIPALAEAILELARDPARRAALGAAGRDFVTESFSMERMMDAYRRVCLGESTLGGPGQGP